MGEDCDDGVRSLWHSCLHSLLYEHGQGGQPLVIDHYHDHGYDHHHHHNFHHRYRSHFHQHQILRLFIVCMKPWWKLIQSKKYQGLSYSYDKPCRQHSKPINFDRNWNIFLTVNIFCVIEVFLWSQNDVNQMLKFFGHQTDEIFFKPKWWNFFVTKLMKYF